MLSTDLYFFSVSLRPLFIYLLIYFFIYFLIYFLIHFLIHFLIYFVPSSLLFISFVLQLCCNYIGVYDYLLQITCLNWLGQRCPLEQYYFKMLTNPP